MAQRIDSYLSTFKVAKGEPHTHTSISGGSFAIPQSARQAFFKHYCTAFLSDGVIPLHLTEKHMNVSPLLIDLDFKQSSHNRRYTLDLLQKFIELYSKYIYDFVQVDGDIDFYVLEKGTQPRYDEKRNIFKDGVHIIAPSIVTKPEIQESIRDCFITNDSDCFADLGLLNPIEDVIDQAVIKTNNWLMYGSNKPSDGEARYLVTWRITVTKNSVKAVQLNDSNDPKYVELLSIHTQRPECAYTAAGEEQLMLRIERVKHEDAFKMSSVSHAENRTFVNLDLNVLGDIELACALVDILNPERASKYDTWINLGICLHNIEPSGDVLLNKWIEFSKKDSKYRLDVEAGVCDEKWCTFEKRHNGLGIGTLRMWAQEDNAEQYAKIVRNNMLYFVSKAVTGTHTDMANVVYHMYGHRFVCVSIKQGIWYEFKQHRWHLIEQAYTLRQLISTEVFRLFLSMAEVYQRKANMCADDESTKFLDKACTFNNLARKLKATGFKDSIIKECAELCFDPGFLEKLDSRHELIVFDNGVYDLDAMCFRDGLPSDFASFTTGYEYTHDTDHEVRSKILKFVGDITINADNADYLMKVCAYMLHGTKYMEQFWFFTGRGRNGKGTLCTLLEKALGNYYYEPDISIVTSTKKSSSGANPEMAKSRGKRVLCASEPDDEDANSKFRVNKLKQLRGNDLIQARGLFKDFVEFRPQFGMIFQMNDKPELSKADDAIGKTLKIIEFPYQFVASPSQEYERLADTQMKANFDKNIQYRQQFMLLLLEYFKKFVHGGKFITEPIEVENATKEYMEENNPVAVWLKENFFLTYQPNDEVTSEALYDMFTCDMHDVKITKKKFGMYMGLLKFKSIVKTGNRRVYKGLQKKPSEVSMAHELLDD